MRIRVLSDLHLEFPQPPLPEVPADVVVLAGDTNLGVRGVRWARQAFPSTPVVYVAGNHEYYKEAYPRLLERLREAAAGSTVTLLEDAALQVGEVTFLGATLWTDYALLGDADAAMHECRRGMTDHRLIRISPGYRRFSPEDAHALHGASRRWLTAALREPGRKVVVTHHAPSPRSLPAPPGSPIDAAYASQLDELVEASGAPLWVHGHLHHCSDYQLGGTRVLCNARGYPDERASGFRPDLIVEL